MCSFWIGSNIEKSVKDLQRCTVSLSRYRVVVKEEMDASIKKMKQVFAELQSWYANTPKSGIFKSERDVKGFN